MLNATAYRVFQGSAKLARPRRFVIASLLLIALTPACGGAPRNSVDVLAADIANANNTLQGVWQLDGFRPDLALDPGLAALLALQLPTMRIRFENGRVHADSPTLHIDRAYSIRDAFGPRFTLVIRDDQGVGDESECEFRDNDHVAFHGTSDPWRGVGSIHRAAP